MQLVLSFSGYRIPVDPAISLSVIQPESALFAIRALIGPVCAVLLGASMVLAWKYPINRRRQEEIRQAIEIGQMDIQSPE